MVLLIMENGPCRFRVEGRVLAIVAPVLDGRKDGASVASICTCILHFTSSMGVLTLRFKLQNCYEVMKLQPTR